MLQVHLQTNLEQKKCCNVVFYVYTVLWEKEKIISKVNRAPYHNKKIVVDKN